LLVDLGTFEKDAGEYYLTATRRFGDLELEVNVSKHETCERRVVGTREVEREVYPEDVQPTITKVTEDIVEWVCPETWKPREVTA
ncbi:MAG TPA: hypothetical protein VIX41_03590, partial [Acidimicrobiales bacterium]